MTLVDKSTHGTTDEGKVALLHGMVHVMARSMGWLPQGAFDAQGIAGPLYIRTHMVPGHCIA